MTVTPIRALQATAPSSDPDSLKKTGQRAFTALVIVTSAAHAVMNTTLAPIPVETTDNADVNAKLAQVSDLLGTVKTNLDTAKGTADTWLETNSGLNDRLSSLIPNHILDYSATYDAVSARIRDLLVKAEQPGADQAQLVSQALDLMQGELLDSVSGYQAEIATASADLESYRKRVQIDHDNLSGSSDSIQKLINIENTAVEQLKSEVSRLHSEIDSKNKDMMDAELGTGISIFVAIVGVAVCATGVGAPVGGALIGVGLVGIGVSAGFWGAAQATINHDFNQISSDETTEGTLNKQITSLTALHMTVDNLVNQIVLAQAALSDVSVFWSTVGQTLDGLVKELKKPNATMSVLRDQTDMEIANKKWQQLKDFAEILVSTTPEVQATPAKAA